MSKLCDLFYLIICESAKHGSAHPSFADISKTMGAEGVKVTKPDEIGPALKSLLATNKPGVLEIVVSRTLADPFRRDALSKPVRHLEKYKEYV